MAQILDTMDIERERGITIKAQAVRVLYRRDDGDWTLNLIDTPGHVDFAYEVSRAIAACEGALLIVDASQGIQAQTLANLYLAMEHDLEIIPVLNKIDLPIADVPAVTEELVELLGVDEDDIIKISAKTGEGVRDVLDAIVDRTPAPKTTQKETRGLVFDSYYDPYRGVVSLVRLVDGELKKGEEVKAMGSEERFELLEVGCYTPKPTALPALHAGEVGYAIAGLKDIDALRVGDTVTRVANPAFEPLPGYARRSRRSSRGCTRRMGTTSSGSGRLWRSCSSTTLTPLRAGELADGLWVPVRLLGAAPHGDHSGEVGERVRPGPHRLLAKRSLRGGARGEVREITNPSDLPEFFEEIREPVVRATLICPKEYVGAVMGLCHERRGISVGMEYISTRGCSLRTICRSRRS
jgi:GTP-binding protein LepA